LVADMHGGVSQRDAAWTRVFAIERGAESLHAL
jgi:hypothetical protein